MMIKKTEKSPKNIILNMLIIAFIIAPLAACGKKPSSLKPRDDWSPAEESYPRTYPAPEEVPAISDDANIVTP